MGIMFGLGILWWYTERVHSAGDKNRGQYQVTAILTRIDHASILFFLGILIAIGGLETSGHLSRLASTLDRWVPNVFALNNLQGIGKGAFIKPIDMPLERAQDRPDSL